MLRKLISTTLIFSHLAAPAAIASGEGSFFYRHTKTVIATPGGNSGPVTPGDPDDAEGLFKAVSPAGLKDTFFAYRESPGLSLELVYADTGQPYWKAAEWQLVSGTLPPGIEAVIDEDKQALRFTGSATQPGTYSDIVYRIRNVDGVEIDSSPITLTVLPRSDMWLWAWPDEPQYFAKVDDVDLRVNLSNRIEGYPVPESGWTVTGELPDGVTYHPVGDGALRFVGKPQVAGNYENISVSVVDGIGREGSIELSMEVVTGFKAENSTSAQFLDQDVGQAALVTRLYEREVYRPFVLGATWELVSGRLPQGITATVSPDGSTLTYSGTPTEAGDFRNIVWLVTGTSGNALRTPPVRFGVGIPPEMVLRSSRGTQFTIDTTTPARIAVTAQDTTDEAGIPAGQWFYDVTQLPPGLSVTSETTGGLVIEGKATKAGKYPVTVSARDGGGRTDDITLQITVANPLEISHGGLLSVKIDQHIGSYNGFIRLLNTKTGEIFADPATTWEMISGRLPRGIVATISEDKSTVRYSGIAEEAGTFSNIVWRATDLNGTTHDSRPLTITVKPNEGLALTRSGATQIRTVSGISYDPKYVRITASNFAPGGIETSKWTVTGVPEGMSVSKQSAYINITGIPQRVGSYTVTVSAVDRVGQSVTQDFVLEVTNGLSAAHFNNKEETISQFGASPTTSLYAVITAANAIYYNGGLVWEHISGTLPPGIGLSPAADGSAMRFTGSATTPGTYGDIVFRVTDQWGHTFETSPFTLKVKELDGISLRSISAVAEGMVNTSLSATVIADNLKQGETLTAANWTVSGLPAGVSSLSYGSDRIYISGKPTAVGTSTAMITVTDSLGRTSSFDLVFNVTAGYKVWRTVNGTTTATSQIGVYEQHESMNALFHLVDAEDNSIYEGEATWTLTSDPGVEGVSVVPEGNGVRFTGYAKSTGSPSNYYYFTVDLPGGKQMEARVQVAVYDRKFGITDSYTPGAIVGFDYTKTITVNYNAFKQNIPVNDWTITGLPPGLRLDAENNVYRIVGQPTKSGTYAVNLTARDALGGTASTSFTMTVAAPFKTLNNYSTYTLKALTQPANHTVILIYPQSGGGYYTKPVTIQRVSGNAPPGVTFEIDPADPGKIKTKGYATATGSYKSVWRITDEHGNWTDSSELTVSVTSRDALSWYTNNPSTSLTLGADRHVGTFRLANEAYGQRLEASDWTVTGLPAGVTKTVDDNGRLELRGTLSTPGTYSITVKGTDKAGASLTRSYTLKVT